MTSREDFGRLAHAAYCDMAGRPVVWESLGPVAQAAWMHVAVTVRDRLQLGISHAYRPDDRPATPQGEESTVAQAKTTLHGGNEEPTVNATDDAELYKREKAMGNTEVRWSGDGPAPDEATEPEHVRVEREQREREELDRRKDAEQDRRDGVSDDADDADDRPGNRIEDKGPQLHGADHDAVAKSTGVKSTPAKAASQSKTGGGTSRGGGSKR